MHPPSTCRPAVGVIRPPKALIVDEAHAIDELRGVFRTIQLSLYTRQSSSCEEIALADKRLHRFALFPWGHRHENADRLVETWKTDKSIWSKNFRSTELKFDVWMLLTSLAWDKAMMFAQQIIGLTFMQCRFGAKL
ncbi:uncharacterized protein LOC130786449 [Actinidia eriantha]|uniref:uncharacterized protein LOC130786449 n=1 Tax=Actinidia eriantha TaxID=165200 RepID=UPI00258263B5|nr:uncharacterized protein LOC130786449 [Actinidia eriantha]